MIIPITRVIVLMFPLHPTTTHNAQNGNLVQFDLYVRQYCISPT